MQETPTVTAPPQPEIEPNPQQYIASPDEQLAPQEVSWTASEFVAHHKTTTWYGMLGGVAVSLALIIFLITKGLIAPLVIILAAGVLAFYAAREPRQLQYKIDSQGLTIAGKFYSLIAFRSFSIVPEGAFSSIILMPLRRFSPAITIYYAPQDEDQIVKILGDQLPFAEHRKDIIESLMRTIRF